MPVTFTHPLYLALLLPLAALLWWASRGSLAGLSRGRHASALVLRAALLLCLVLALAGAQSVQRNRELAVFFLVDVSDSVPRSGVDSALNYIRTAVKNMRTSDQAGVIVFGKNAVVEHELSSRLTLDAIHSQVDTHQTDAAAAVRLALASIPPGATARLVLFTDGNETIGRLEEQIQLAQAQGVTVDVVPMERPASDEATVEKLVMPTEVKIGEPFSVQAIVTATAAENVVAHLLRDDKPIASRQFTLTPGKNTLTFPQVVEDAGFHEYELLIEPPADLVAENNRGLAFTRVRGRPKVLYIEGKPGEEQHLRHALAAQNIDVDFRTPHAIPTTAEDLQRYDALLLSDVVATAMAPEQMRLIEQSVRETGLGFGMIGGDESFGAGGYFKTPIEEALPVSMDVRKERVFPSLAVVLSIDASGSMGMQIGGVTKLAMAATAANATLDLMRPQDFLGIHVDGVTQQVLSDVRPATDVPALQKAIKSITYGGGGYFYTPSLQYCLQLFRGTKASQKHLIILADGDDVDMLGGEIAITSQLVKEGVTISTVAFGQGKDVAFLRQMAALGGGKSYIAAKPTDLPRIFTRDTLVVGRSVIVEEPFKPRIDPGDEILRGLPWDTVPPMYGYVATSPKDLASVPMLTHHDDPLFAHWNYGLGRAIAFTSDAKARWAREWVGWPAFGPFWAQAIRWSLRKMSNSRFQSNIEVHEGKADLSVDALDEHGEFINNLAATATITGPDGTEQKLPLRQIAPGRYALQFPATGVGTYLVTIADDKDQSVSTTTGFSLPYPAEYARLTPNRPLLERVAALGRGAINPAPAAVFTLPPTVRPLLSDLWPLLLLAALLLVPVDIGVRRLAIGWPEVAGAFARLRAALRRALGRLRRPVPVPQPTLGHLRAAKERAGTRSQKEVVTSTPPLRSSERGLGGEGSPLSTPVGRGQGKGTLPLSSQERGSGGEAVIPSLSQTGEGPERSEEGEGERGRGAKRQDEPATEPAMSHLLEQKRRRSSEKPPASR